MIRLNKNTNEKERVLEIINNAVDDSTLELECLINGGNISQNIPTISHSSFILILKRFKHNPEFDTKISTKLNINFPNTSKFKDVRITIKGNGPINNYCNNESLTQILNNTDFEIKERAKTRINQVRIENYNIKFNLKVEKNFNNDEAKIRDIIREMPNEMKNYRYKKTFSFIKKTGDFSIDISIVKSSSTYDKFVTVKEVIDDGLLSYVSKPSNYKGNFQSWWKSIEDKPSEKVMIKNATSFSRNIKESNVFTNLPHYEAEIEYIRNKTTQKPKFKTSTEKSEFINTQYVNFFKLIGMLLQCVQNSFYLISNDDKIRIKKEMIATIESSIALPTTTSGGGKKNSKESKKSKESNESKESKKTSEFTSTTVETRINPDGDLEFKPMNGGANKTTIIDSEHYESKDESNHEEDPDIDLEAGDEMVNQDGGAFVPYKKKDKMNIKELKEYIVRNLEKNIFFGPLIVDLTHRNCAPIDPNTIPESATNTNIQINYLVTEKADGERNLLYINQDGRAYGIDRSKNMRYFGITMPTMANSIFDGEFVNRDETNKMINNFYIFDCYVYKGENIMGKPFLWKKTTGRHNALTNMTKYFSTATDIVQDNPKIPFLVFCKDYLPSDNPKTFSQLEQGDVPLIFQNCRKILNKMNKKYGGFLEEGHLFTYKTDGLVFLPNNLSVFQTHEGDNIINPFVEATWHLNYKAKPRDHLSIDFKVEYVKDLSSNSLTYYYEDGKKYIKVNLMSKIYQSSDGRDNKYNNVLNYYLLNSGISIKNIPEDFKFFAYNPFVGNIDNEGNHDMGECYLLLDNNDNVVCENGDFITDNMIVEFNYKYDEPDEKMRWNPMRIRADKKNANMYSTALSAWQLINDPITKEYLSGYDHENIETISGTIESDDTEEGSKVVNTTRLNMQNKVYYTADKNVALQTEPLNKFNNFVKSYLISKTLNGYVKPRVMDLACGRMGDRLKYVHSGVDMLLGIDIVPDNIYNPIDGAATRMLDGAHSSPQGAKLADKTIVLVGDTRKNIYTGEAVTDKFNRYYLDVLYGRAKGNTTKLKKLESVALDGFDVISCMFAIHYMWNNEEELDNFFQNINENLLDQGYFIGTCFDGMEIMKEMGSKEELVGMVDGKVIYMIKKLPDYDYTKIEASSKINVFFETFHGHFDENLINMTYIKKKALEHNLKLIEYKGFLEEPGNLLSQFENDKKEYAKSVENTEALNRWARFERYFVFQKIRDK